MPHQLQRPSPDSVPTLKGCSLFGDVKIMWDILVSCREALTLKLVLDRRGVSD